MAAVIAAICTALTGYLLGSISFSIILTKLFIQKDIRSFGSGNAGATNVLRSVGKKAAALTFVLDFLKCVAAVLIGRAIFTYAGAVTSPALLPEYGVYLAGLFCFIGHIYPLYFHFRGGKGVVTATAMILLTDWRVLLLLAVVFFILFFIWHYVSLSSICAAAVYPLATFCVTFFVDYVNSPLQLGGDKPLAYVVVATVISLLMGIIVIAKHSTNIKRLLAGKESKIIFSDMKR